MMQQARELGGRPHVVVATPGRLHDLLKNCAGDDWDLSRVKTVVSILVPFPMIARLIFLSFPSGTG